MGFHKPVCAQCHVDMRADLNGVLLVEYAHNPPVPYQSWQADRWACPVCGAKVIVGFADKAYPAFMEHFALEMQVATEQNRVEPCYEIDQTGKVRTPIPPEETP